MSTEDLVNHPSHYAEGWSNGAEVIDITENLNFNRGNAVKYIARSGKKDPSKELEDLAKAKWYVEREIQRIEFAAELPVVELDVPDADRFFIDFLDSPVKPRVWDSIHDVPADTTVVDLEGALFRWASTGSSLLWWGDDWDEDPEGWDSWGPVTVSFSEAFGPFTEVIA